MSQGTQPEASFLLRSEWLRLRNQLFDANTQLPTLAAVLDDVGRLLQERGTLGLLYLDLADAGQLEPLHGWQWYDVDLERLCRRQAVSTARHHLGDAAKLFVNTSAAALRDPELAGPGFRSQLEAQGLAAGDFVLEVSERAAAEEPTPHAETLRQLKTRGFGIASDDMGAGYASLQSIVEVEPDYLKVDLSLVRDIHRNSIKQSLLETLVELSQKVGARVIAEAIEAASELAALRGMGVPFAQGRYLAPPSPIPVGVCLT